MRSRNIKPGFFRNAELLECEPLARLLFAGLWCMADREGRLEDRPNKIKIEILPCDNCNTDELLEQLRSNGFITRYSFNGGKYIQIVNFNKHQNPHKNESVSVIPCASTVQAPDNSGASTVQIGLIPDSLIPDSLIPDSLIADAYASDSSVRESILEDLPEPVVRPPKKNPYTPEFLRFWAEYPYQKGSKARAQELYNNALKTGVSHDELLRAATDYAGFIRATGTERRFTKNADTWLGRERQWETDWGAAARQAGEVTGGGADQHGGDGAFTGAGGQPYRNGSAGRRESPHDVFARAWAHASEKYSESGRVADA